MMGGKYWYFVRSPYMNLALLPFRLYHIQYRLDGDLEYHNPAEPSTTSCPFLPGQNVNILDVPKQANEKGVRLGNESIGSFGFDVYTMDPEAKYLNPKPSVGNKARDPLVEVSFNTHPPPLARYSRMVAARSLPNLFSAASNKDTSAELSLPRTSASPAVSRRSSLLKVFQKRRVTKSAGCSDHQMVRYGSALFATEPKDLSIENPSRLQLDTRLLKASGPQTVTLKRSPLRQSARPLSTETRAQARVNSEDHVTSILMVKVQEHFSARTIRLSQKHLPNRDGSGSLGALNHELPSIPESSSYTPLDQLREHNSFFVKEASDCLRQAPSIVGTDGLASIPGGRSSVHPISRNQPGSLDVEPAPTSDPALEPHSDNFFPSETSFLHDESECDPPSQEKSVSSSENPHEVFSPGLAASTTYTDAMSLCRLSQPITPVRSDFGEGLLDPRDDLDSEKFSKTTVNDPGKLCTESLHEQPFVMSEHTMYQASGGFEGYSLPEDRRSSVLTLRNLPDPTCTSPSGDSPFSPQASKDLIQSWNDGGEHRINNMTALEDLMEDLGYLGEIIV